MEQNIWSAIIAAITVLGGTSAFRYYEKRQKHREEEDDFIRIDCKDRISKLEILLEQSAQEKDNLRNLVLELTREVAELRVKVDFLSKENQMLLHKQHKIE